MGWQNYGDVWMNDETGEISETDPNPAPAPAAPASTAPVSAPAVAPVVPPNELPGARPGITAPAAGRPTPLPTAPNEAALAEQESSSGKGMHLYRPDNDGVVSGGAYGFRGDTVKGLLKNDAHLREKHPELMAMSYDEIANRLNHDPELDDELFNVAYPPILAKHKGDVHAAYAEWNGGPIAGAAWDKNLRGEPLTDKEQRKLDAVLPNVADYDRRLAKLQGATATEPAPSEIPAHAPTSFQPIYARGADAPQDLTRYDASNFTNEHEAPPPGPTPPGEPTPPALGTPGTGVGAVAVDRSGAQGPGVGMVNASGAPAAYTDTSGVTTNAPARGRDALTKDEMTSATPSAAEGTDATPAATPLEGTLDGLQAKILKDVDGDSDWDEAQHKKLEQLLSDAQNAKVQPNHLWASMSTPQRILAAISLGLGAAGASLTHTQNTAAQIIQEAITDDVRAQEAEVGKRQSIYATALHEFGTERQARTAAVLAKLQVVRSMIAEAKIDHGAGGMKQGTVNTIADIKGGISALNAYEKALDSGFSGKFGEWMAKYNPWSNSAAAGAARPATALSVARAEHPGRAPGADYVKQISEALGGPENTKDVQKAKLNSLRERLQQDLAERLSLNKGGFAAAEETAAPADDKAQSYEDVSDEEK